MREKVEKILDTHVRPLLRNHNGNLEIIDISQGVVTFKLLGQCAGCPSADITNEEIVQAELIRHIPEITKAVMIKHSNTDLIRQAREIMRQKSANK